MTEEDFIRVLKQYAKDIRAACSGSSDADPGWAQAEILDFVAENLHEIAANQPSPQVTSGPQEN